MLYGFVHIGCTFNYLQLLRRYTRIIAGKMSRISKQSEKRKENVRIRYGDGCVHIQNDAALYAYLHQKPHAEYCLADHILRTYRERYGKELKITVKSLATEILWHVIVYRLMKMTCMPGKKLDQRMRVIDCGGRDVDNNRFVWDLLSLSPWRQMG